MCNITGDTRHTHTQAHCYCLFQLIFWYCLCRWRPSFSLLRKAPIGSPRWRQQPSHFEWLSLLALCCCCSCLTHGNRYIAADHRPHNNALITLINISANSKDSCMYRMAGVSAYFFCFFNFYFELFESLDFRLVIKAIFAKVFGFTKLYQYPL